MNAKEIDIPQITTLLQQQADHITELEKELKRTKFAWNMAENEIERLTPQTSAEPAAWFEPITKSILNNDEYQNNQFANETGDWIPLYTTPQTKPLSDKEILNLLNENYDGGMPSGRINPNQSIISFARQIEERHGIK